jgi:class 3 adenylate cyclase
MQQIADWLEKLGMSEYAQRFAENDIDVEILNELTDKDFDRLGVSIGHRRKIMRAIREFAAPPVSAVMDRPASAAAASEAAPTDTAERRQVTVMFSDLVGSTALSARMDPEDLREVISAYQKCVAETVGRFGGFVAKYMGDGVLIYFGYPQAHEDDAERAVRAGLELIAAVSSLKTRAPLQTRIGIATGLVIVGDLIGSGASQEQAIVGETPNLAARLQGIAEPNSVVIAESTRKLVGNLFELEDLGTQDLKGIASPVQAWAALRPSSVESRFEAFHASGLTELVGREEELELLLRRWSKAKTGEGQVVLLSGEPGIGKSRLTAALLERLTGEPHTRLRYFCSPQHTDSAVYPIISQMERAAGFAHQDALQAKLDKLDALLAQSFTPRQDAALLADMMSLPNDGRYPTLNLSPQQRRQKTLEALNAQLEALSKISLVLMIFEDVHWIDPTSLEVLARAVDRIRTLAALLIVTYRPEFEPSWVGLPHVSAVTVNRLGQREIAAMVDRLAGNKALSANIRHEIVERTDGIPLFVEEMTKAVVEVESEVAAERTVATAPSARQAVPATLHASLMARLDRLGPAKEVAQIGAAIGRDFSDELIGAIARKPEPELKAALDRLIEAGLLFGHGVSPHRTYVFKHALVRDAAYSTLLRGRRQELHNQIVSALQLNFPELVVSQPEVLAHHSAEAGALVEAIEYHILAAKRATAAMNNKEATAHLKRGWILLEQLPASDPRRPKLISRVAGAGWWLSS